MVKAPERSSRPGKRPKTKRPARKRVAAKQAKAKSPASKRAVRKRSVTKPSATRKRPGKRAATKKPTRPKTRTRRAKAQGTTVPADVVDRVILLLTGGMNIETARVFCRQSGLDEQGIDAAVMEARRRLTAAVEFHRDEEFSLAVRQLKHLYVMALKVEDLTAATQARKELNRLLWLYVPNSAPPAEEAAIGLTTEDAELALEHLRPLALTEDGAGLVELCRLAAAKVTELLAEVGRK